MKPDNEWSGRDDDVECGSACVCVCLNGRVNEWRGGVEQGEVEEKGPADEDFAR